MLDAILTLAAGLILLGCLLFFCVAAVAMNVGERRQRDNRRDLEARSRARAHEAVARHDLYWIPPAEKRVEKGWRRSA